MDDSFALEKELAPNTLARLMRAAARGDLADVETKLAVHQGTKPYRSGELRALTDLVLSGRHDLWALDGDDDEPDETLERPVPKLRTATARARASASWDKVINEQVPVTVGRTVSITNEHHQPLRSYPAIPTSRSWER